jgi:arylsulfatase A-like enzyme
MKQDVPNLLLAGLLLGLIEVVWVLARAGELFLSAGERLLYATASATALASCVLALGCLMSVSSTFGPRRARMMRFGCAALASGVAALLLWSMSDGRRVRDLAARPWAVAALSLLAGFAIYLLPRAIARGREHLSARGRFSVGAACALACALLLAADALVLPRGYPAFHLALGLLALLSASALGLVAGASHSERRRAALCWTALGCLALAPLALARVAAHPTAGFAVRETAPWTARLLSPFTPTPSSGPARTAALAAPASGHAGVDLRDRDVLLITIDALRADLLRAYGGGGHTPQIDRLADEGALFTRAYTPAPHTSYALASLLTGKFVKPLVELGGKLGDPPTVADRLRRYGYRTAAFYPPAVFFVDGASFAPLAARGFGFEYRKEMFASADERVDQLDAYLAQAEAKRPLFVWMHLFEPHEPYDPPADIAHDGTERGRYVAEVAACDRAIGKMVEHFRALRPRATVIITADHGEEFGDHGGSFHGSSLYDEQVRIPLVWSSPGAVAARRIAAPVELTDVGTTILATAAVPRDAHMRGDDLGALLAGDDSAAPRFAFASIAERHMVTDGRHKAICGAREPHCALFDLKLDPLETRNVAGRAPDVARALRAELDAFLSSIPQVEALTVSAGVELPEALARVKVGASSTGEELVPLLADARASVRAEAARLLGERGLTSARAELDRLRVHDRDPTVRAEATIASLRLGTDAALADGLALLSQRDGASAQAGEARARARLAALALAPFKRVEALPLLSELALDESATEVQRLQALAALGQLGSVDAVAPLLSALASVRLREAAARALGALGDPRAIDPLRAQLSIERYPPARQAEAEALRQLGDPSLGVLVVRALGMESSLPDGVRLLTQLGELAPPSRGGALLAEPSIRHGTWRCEQGACTPQADARLVLPARGAAVRAPVRVVLWFQNAQPGAVLQVDGERFTLRTEAGQLSFVRATSASATRFSLSRDGEVALVALAVVPSVAELPPPAPEPWDAGSSKESSPPLVGDSASDGSVDASRPSR